MHDEPPRRRAALAGRADRAEQDRAHRQIEPRVLGDDDRVVAAELEDGAAEARRDGLRRRGGRRCVDPVNEISGSRAVVQHPLADRPTPARPPA